MIMENLPISDGHQGLQNVVASGDLCEKHGVKIARVSDLSRDYGESESEGAHGKGGVVNRIARPGQDRTRDEAVLTLFFF